MTPDQCGSTDWPRALHRYLGVSLLAHLGWEILQLPLYTLWSTGTLKQQAFAVAHCTLGDAMIAGLSLLLALALFASATWPRASVSRVYFASLPFGIGYTIYSEWLNINVRGSWAYSDMMPVVPMIGTGLAPLLQWVIIPTLAFRVAIGRAPWNSDQWPTPA
jgi:hypothetical protein